MKKYFALAILAQLLWSLSPSASRYCIRYMPVELFVAMRWSLSGLVFVFLVLVRHGRFTVTQRDFPRLCGLGIAGYALASLGTVHAMKWGGVVHYSLVSAFSPTLSALTAVIVLKETVGPRVRAAFVVCLTGLLFLVLGQNHLGGSGASLLCTLLILLSYLCQSLAFIYARHYKDRYPLFEYMALLQMSAGLATWLAIACGAGGLRAFDWGQVPTSAWIIFGLSSIVSCVLCYGLVYWLLGYIEAHRLALFDGLSAVFAAFFGVLFFSEAVNGWMATGAALLVAGLLMVAQSKRSDAILVEEPTRLRA